jgi:hypothetical protein
MPTKKKAKRKTIHKKIKIETLLSRRAFVMFGNIYGEGRL